MATNLKPLCIAFMVLTGFADCSSASSAKPSELSSLERQAGTIQREVLKERHVAHQWKTKLEAAGVQLGPWFRIGPFRDLPPENSWVKNMHSSFAYEFEVEKDVLKQGMPNFKKSYAAPNFPATPNWTAPLRV